MELDVTLRAARPLLIRNDLVEADLLLANEGLVLTGTNGRFGLRGTVDVKRGGRITLRRNVFEITQGTVRFDDATRSVHSDRSLPRLRGLEARSALEDRVDDVVAGAQEARHVVDRERGAEHLVHVLDGLDLEPAQDVLRDLLQILLVLLRDHDRVEPGRVLEQFQPDRSGTGDNLWIVEWMNKDKALLDRQLARLGVGVVEHVAVKHDVRAVPRGLGYLHRRRVGRHDDGRRDAQTLRMISDRLRVVAGGCGDDSAGAVQSSMESMVAPPEAVAGSSSGAAKSGGNTFNIVVNASGGDGKSIAAAVKDALIEVLEGDVMQAGGMAAA